MHPPTQTERQALDAAIDTIADAPVESVDQIWINGVKQLPTERQTPNAASKRTTTRRRPRKDSTALPYPELPDDDAHHALFWLAAWLRHQKQVEEFKAHVRSRSWASYSLSLGHALCHAEIISEKEANDALVNLVQSGGLLFAWHGTTALDNLSAAQ